MYLYILLMVAISAMSFISMASYILCHSAESYMQKRKKKNYHGVYILMQNNSIQLFCLSVR